MLRDSCVLSLVVAFVQLGSAVVDTGSDACKGVLSHALGSIGMDPTRELAKALMEVRLSCE